jgi:AraC family transcriptional regulator of adaptative response/methylated-DNA-[protein]-cysteine methyltransferase
MAEMTQAAGAAPSATGSAEAGVDETGRWEAVRRRDREADGTFVYAVRTTGVYCRPSCPARPARRENVSFHATPADAERAGFRSCLRCRPGEAPRGEREAQAVAAACRLIEAAEEPPPLAELAAAAGFSPHHFHRMFKRVAGVTPRPTPRRIGPGASPPGCARPRP